MFINLKIKKRKNEENMTNKEENITMTFIPFFAVVIKNTKVKLKGWKNIENL